MDAECCAKENEPNWLIAVHCNDQHGLHELLVGFLFAHCGHCQPNNGIRQGAQQANHQQPNSIPQRANFIAQFGAPSEFSASLVQKDGQLCNCTQMIIQCAQLIKFHKKQSQSPLGQSHSQAIWMRKMP
jgi:hypothetical protein